MNHESVAGAKSDLRQRLIAERNLRHISRDETVDVGLTRNLIRLCVQLKARTVACYLSFGTEPTTVGFLRWARENGVRVLLPISLPDGELEWVESASEETSKGIFGFAEALGEIADFEEVDLVLVPALAVDRSGVRLGKGKGYYDRALATPNSKSILAVVYDAEVVDQIPCESHDVKVGGFVTESRIVLNAI